MSRQLPLHAEFALLVHDDATGRVLVDSTKLKAGIAGAAVVELTLQGALRLEGEGRRARLHGTGQTVAPELGEALARADGQSPKNAVARIGGGSSFTDRAGRLLDATLADLERAEVGSRDQERILGIFPRQVWRERDPRLEQAILERVRQAIDGAVPDERTAALIALLHATGLLRKLFPELDKRALSARAADISAGGWGGDAVRKAVEEVQAAVTAAVIAAGAAATAGSS